MLPFSRVLGGVDGCGRKLSEHRITKYDGRCERPFDMEERTQPKPTHYRELIQKYIRGNRLGDAVAFLDEGTAIADEMLRARGLIGIVLGSALRTLAQNQNDRQALHRHHDLDVLILNPHSRKNPAPNEGGIDWFVRPEGQAPTNGRAELWYDIELKQTVRIRGRGQRPSYAITTGYTHDSHGMVWRIKRRSDRLSLSKASAGKTDLPVSVPACLYLPDAETVDAIRNHAAHKVRAAVERCAGVCDRLRKYPQTVAQYVEDARQELGDDFWEDGCRANAPFTVAEECIDEAVVALRSIGVTAEVLKRQARIDKHEFFRRKMQEGEPATLLWTRDELLRALDYCMRQHEKELNPYRFSHLNLRGIDLTNAALPILPHQLMTFTGL